MGVELEGIIPDRIRDMCDSCYEVVHHSSIKEADGLEFVAEYKCSCGEEWTCGWNLEFATAAGASKWGGCF